MMAPFADVVNPVILRHTDPWHRVRNSTLFNAGVILGIEVMNHCGCVVTIVSITRCWLISTSPWLRQKVIHYARSIC